MKRLLMQMFGRPRGLLGRLGGVIMARGNRDCGIWVAETLDIRPGEAVLEVGFGPGVVIRHMATRSAAAHVAGIDPSHEMLEQARARNEDAIRSGRVDLRLGSVERLPFADDRFDTAMAVNSMQVWPDAAAGVREVHRVLKPGGRLALGFTPHSRQPKEGLEDLLRASGFVDARTIEKGRDFCVLATKP